MILATLESLLIQVQVAEVKGSRYPILNDL